MRTVTCLTIFAASLCLIGCSSTATYLTPQPSVYYKSIDSGNISLGDPDLQSLFDLKCMKSMPQGPATFGSAKEAPQCLYIAVDTSKANFPTTTSRAVRDKAIAYLLNISEANCTNFLDRSFASRSGLDFSKSLAQDITTGVGAMAAFNTPAVTAALGMANLVIGSTADNVSSNYYFSQTFQAYEAAVLTERARIKSEIIAKQANRPPASNDIVPYTLFDAFSDVRAYDAACSMRVGLAKLNETQGDRKQQQLQQSAIADRDAAKKSLETAQQRQ